MNETSERVLLKFTTLLKNNPNGNVPFLWVQAGGKVASQQSVQATEWWRCSNPECLCRNGNDHNNCVACGSLRA